MSPASGSANARLLWHYENRHAEAIRKHEDGVPALAVTSNTVPRELIEAAGLFPFLLSCEVRRASGGTPLSHTFMEDAFDSRTRAMFDFLTSSDAGFVSAVILPRTSEPEHKLFLYLKEIQRQNESIGVPDVYLYNLLHTRSSEARAYSWERTQEFQAWLEKRVGRKIAAESLERTIATNNVARAGARRLNALRTDTEPRLSGSEALALLGARYFLDPADYAALAAECAAEVEKREPLQGPRILIKGFPLDHPYLHLELQAHGAIVFAEDDWWGSRSAAEDISLSGAPLESIFHHYYANEVSPRVLPLPVADQWFQDTARHTDGVVFYLPPDDDVIGWDYPRHHRYLDELGIPHLLIRMDALRLAGAPPSDIETVLEVERTRERIADFVGRLL